jgi:hypothetical protein
LLKQTQTFLTQQFSPGGSASSTSAGTGLSSGNLSTGSGN